ncbi:MAG TPA: NAD(P)H-dependent oxidoreductase [Polyangiaceae bacterium]|nr:NAD(P)H-dependent oxidoreductase [Polyangiaceae bacterium]
MPSLHVVVVSTRPGRGGLAVGKWFEERARQHGGFDVTLVDLAEVNLPLLDEPKHPRFQDYTQEHTKKWSAIVSAADAFVFVTPEYNYGMAPTLLNALDFLFREWNYKPAAFVSYGGVSGGMRSQQMAKLVITSLRMMPIPEAVAIQYYERSLKDGVFTGDEAQAKAAKGMLDELLRWTNALRPMRG